MLVTPLLIWFLFGLFSGITSTCIIFGYNINIENKNCMKYRDEKIPIYWGKLWLFLFITCYFGIGLLMLLAR